MTNVKVEFHDSGPDGQGRRFFTVTWTDHDGVFRKDLDKDGSPVGYRRGQCFRSNDWKRFTKLTGETS